MPDASFFSKLGVLILPEVLAPADCDRIRAEMRGAPQSEALLSVRGRTDEVVDGRQRRTARAQVSEEASAFVVERLRALKADVEGFFALRLADTLEVPKFLIYRPGDFFIPHRDVKKSKEEGRTPLIDARRVNLIINLNRESREPAAGCYSGGGLTLYGLIDQPRWKTYGFPVCSSPGSLIAFRSDVLHEAVPVEAGERYTIVSRMLAHGFRPVRSPGATDRADDHSSVPR
jgi:predicted 2-oxoglutarate/Fe(II)-dependent dioxygenase YbiX